jgi:ATP:ADP antiporter, AAA family
MVARLRRFFDVRSGEGLRALLSFLYIAIVAAAFLLARPIRNGLFLQQYGAYALVYAYASVSVVLSIFVFIYARVTARFGVRSVTVATLIFFSLNVILFWYIFAFHAEAVGRPGSAAWFLPGVFYVWVNCFGVIAPVQAWSFANSLFDTRQAKRLFGLIAAGASLGAIAAGLLARLLVGPVGGTVNLLLVLAALIMAAAAIVSFANARLLAQVVSRRGRAPKHPLRETVRTIARSRYLRLMAALVFFTAIATQWTQFQLSLVADRRFAGNADALTAFFGVFNFALGTISFLLQLLLLGPALRRFGLALSILVLPFALGGGSLLIVLAPGVLTVLLTNAIDQGFRFSLDKATYELLYLPLVPAQRGPVKTGIDVVVSRCADAVGAVLLGVATEGFVIIHGIGLGLRGTAAVNLIFIAAWFAVAWQLRREYVRTIQKSIHQHRLDSEQIAPGAIDRSAAAALAAKLASTEPSDVRYALDLLSSESVPGVERQLRALLAHPEADIRRRALAMLSAARDPSISAAATNLLRDPDLGVRTEALLYVTRELRVDPLRQLEKLGDVEDFSIRAGMAAFLASPGPSQNLDAARVMLAAMAGSREKGGARDRLQAARVLSLVPGLFTDLLVALIDDPDPAVARQAIGAASVVMRDDIVNALMSALGRPELTTDAAIKLVRYGNGLVPEISGRLLDPQTPVEMKRELPQVLVRIGTPAAEEVLIENLLQPDVTLRHRVISSLNKLHDAHPDVRIDERLVDVVLAAEIAGHYRSYQVLGPLREQLKEDDSVLQAMHQSMEQELERIFRLMALVFPGQSLHDAYIGVRSINPTVRANALEFLDNVLKPELRRLLVPLLDSQISVDERIAMANQIVGAPLETAEQSIATLLASGDPWLKSSAVYAIGILRLQNLEAELHKLETTADPFLREHVEVALHRLSAEADGGEPAVPAGMAGGFG